MSSLARLTSARRAASTWPRWRRPAIRSVIRALVGWSAASLARTSGGRGRAQHRLRPQREPGHEPVAAARGRRGSRGEVADAEVLGPEHGGLHQRAADALAAVALGDVRCQRLHRRLEVERGHRRDAQQHGPGRLAVVLRDEEAPLGRRRGLLDDELEVVDLLLPVGPAEDVAPQLDQERYVADRRLTHRHRLPAHRGPLSHAVQMTLYARLGPPSHTTGASLATGSRHARQRHHGPARRHGWGTAR